MNREAGMSWDEAMSLHRLIAAAYGVSRQESGCGERVRWVVADLVTQDLPIEARSLLEALDRWHEDGEAEDAHLILQAVQPVVDMYTSWFESRARPDMEALARQTVE